MPQSDDGTRRWPGTRATPSRPQRRWPTTTPPCGRPRSERSGGSVSSTARCCRLSLGDPSPIVRRRAAELAAGDRAVSLLAVLDDHDPTVVEVAAFACGEQGRQDDPDGAAVVARLGDLAIGHDDALVREAAVAALGAIGDPAGLPAILAATRDKATVRRRAIIALAPFDGPEVDEALSRASVDRDWQVRQAAEDQLTP